MSVDREAVLAALGRVAVPGRRESIVQADMVRAVTVENGTVRFVLEVDPAEGARMEPVRAEAERAVSKLPGVAQVVAILTAHGPAQAQPQAAQGKGPPPSMKIGRHPTPQAGPAAVPGVKNVILVGSGKGGVGKSTVAANLAVALAGAGKSVGLLDADIYGPSVPRIMGVSGRPASPDGQSIVPLKGHGVTVMSIGLMVAEGEAVIWRGPMLMGALQQLMGQVRWGELDVLLVDLPPGTGDVQLTLSQKFRLAGAIVVSTPQDLALLDARKAVDMFRKTKVPILGLVEHVLLYLPAMRPRGASLRPWRRAQGRGGERAALPRGDPARHRDPHRRRCRDAGRRLRSRKPRGDGVPVHRGQARERRHGVNADQRMIRKPAASGIAAGCVSTRSTRAARGPWRSRATIWATLSSGPAISARTAPSASLRTQPASPSPPA